MSNTDLRHTVESEHASHQRLLRPGDGKLVPLVVQGFESPIQLPKTRAWTRTGKPQDHTSPIVKLTYWIWSSTLQDGSFATTYTMASLGAVALKWIVSWPLMLFFLCVSQDTQVTPTMTMFNKYDPVPIKPERDGEDDALMPPDPASSEHIRLSADLPRIQRTSPSRQFRPRYLCFLPDQHEPGKPLFETRNVSKWIEENRGHVDTEYVFVSYTRMQFRVATQEEIAKYDYPSEDIRAANSDAAKKDRETLIHWGIESARAAGKKAFWLDFECIRDDDHVARSTSASDDVYHICDVVRAAHSMIIAIGPSVSSRIAGVEQKYTATNETLWLQEWGSRLWTLPEILLCPSETRIKLYTIGSPDGPKSVAKRNFAERAWADADEVGMLVDHYEGSVHLTPLQLMGVALECFSRRKTDQWSQGDIAYALMGLLRQRPQVNKQDSGFQAFARLSLANDSNRLLERLLCMLPPRKNAPWHEIKDCWGAKLWDIDSSCQVAEVVDDQTVSLDGAYGAAIQWDSVDPPSCIEESTLGSRLKIMLLGLVPSTMLAALVLFFQKEYFLQRARDQAITILRSMALGSFVLAALLALTAPAFILKHRTKPFKEIQARFLGVEGNVDVGLVERYLLGFNHGRLVEMGGSPSQRYRDNATENPSEEPESERRFTLIDTYTMTVTRFCAERPPVAVFICGQDRGMQRALLCSYDWRSNSFHRETILRMKTTVLAKMERVEKLRLSLTSPSHEQAARRLLGSTDEEAGLGQAEDATASTMPLEYRSSLRRVDLTLVVTMLLIYGVPNNFIYLSNQLDVPHIIRQSAFVLTQIPAYFLLGRFHIGRVISLPILLKGMTGMLLVVQPYHLGHTGLTEAIKGMADGVILPAFVFLTFSWYTPREILVRLLLWTFGKQIVHISYAIGGLLGTRHVLSITSAVLAMACVPLSLYAFHYAGTPKQIRWLPAYERTVFATLSAAQAYAPTAIQWQKSKVTAIFQDAQTWLIFCISLLDATLLPPLWPFYESFAPEWLPIAITIVACLVFHNFHIPKVASMAATLVLWTIGTPILMGSLQRNPAAHPAGHFGLYLAYAIACVHIIMQPLMWTLIALNVADSDKRLATLCTAFVGTAIGEFVSYLALIRNAFDFPMYLPVTLAELLLLAALFWYYLWRNGWRAAWKGGRDGPGQVVAGEDVTVDDGRRDGGRSDDDLVVQEERRPSFRYSY